jgi:hypothetical protein
LRRGDRRILVKLSYSREELLADHSTSGRKSKLGTGCTADSTPPEPTSRRARSTAGRP